MGAERMPSPSATRIRRAVRRAGGEVTLTRRCHLRVTYGGRSTVVGSKHGDPCSFRNAMAQIRRATGLELGLTPG